MFLEKDIAVQLNRIIINLKICDDSRGYDFILFYAIRVECKIPVLRPIIPSYKKCPIPEPGNLLGFDIPEWQKLLQAIGGIIALFSRFQF